MGLFSSFRSGVGKLFGGVKKLFTPSSEKPTSMIDRKRRGKDEADAHAKGQAARRKKLLQSRVQQGKSSEVYQNLKGGAGSSVYLKDFLAGMPMSRFSSSNVNSIVYDIRHDHLYVQFLRGRKQKDRTGASRKFAGPWYRYSTVTPQEATLIYNAASKGIWVWDHLRVRGSNTASRKPCVKAAPPDYLAIEGSITPEALKKLQAIVAAPGFSRKP